MVTDQAELVLMAQLYEQYGSGLYGYALSYTGDRDRAAEVVQDVMVRAWSNPDKVHPHAGSPKAWLFTVARRLCIDDHRRRRARHETPVDDMTLSAAAARARQYDDVFDRMIEAWHMETALGRLSPEHRAVLDELYYRGHSVNEAAARLGIRTGTVKSRAFYAVRALRAVLEDMGVPT